MMVPASIEGEKGVFLDGGVADIAGIDGCSITERVLYHHATIAPITMTHTHRFHPSQLTSIHIPELPYITPFTMDRGAAAYDIGYRATKRMLGQPRKPKQVITPWQEQLRSRL